MKPSRLIAFFGHHKCATTWINDILAAVCVELGLNLAILSNAKEFGGDLAAYVTDNRVDAIAYINADYSFVRQLENYDLKGFHVIRDPRDIVVSAYFSHLYSHKTENWPDLVKYRQKLQAADRSDGLMLELNNRRYQFSQMDSWNYQDARIMELKMEDLTANPYQLFLEIFRFLELLDERNFLFTERMAYLLNWGARGLQEKSRLPIWSPPEKIPVERLLGIVWENSFEKKSGGRQIGEEKVESHYRKGIAGDWKNHFKQEQIDYFRSTYDGLLTRLGYENEDLD